MNPRQFFVGRAIGFLVLLALIGIVAGFFWLNDSLYEEKRGTGTEQPIVGELEEGGEADPSRMTLDMTVWRWITATVDGKEVKPDVEGEFTITLKRDGTFTGTTDCNAMQGSYTSDSDSIDFGQVVTTDMACGDSQQRVFTDILESAEGYHFTTRGQLILELRNGGTATFL